MKLITTTALALVAALAAAPATAQTPSAPAQQQVKITPSKPALKAISDLNDAVTKSDFASVPAKVAAAQAVATTKDDRYLIGQLQLKAALAEKNDAATAAAIDTLASSGYLEPSKTSQLYLGLGGTFFNNKQYPQAAAAYQKALALDPNNTEAGSLLGESLFAQGQKAEAAAAFQRAIQVRVAAGQKPEEGLVKRAVAVAYDAKSPAAIELPAVGIRLSQRWQLERRDRDLHQPQPSGRRGHARPPRLMQVTGALNNGGEYAQHAARRPSSTISTRRRLLDAGVVAKPIDPSKPSTAISTVSKPSPSDGGRPRRSDQDRTERHGAAADRRSLLRDGNYAKAIELYKMSMGKPGVDAAIANPHI
jgi:tetratricopeptide (TPR) repeat protein